MGKEVVRRADTCNELDISGQAVGGVMAIGIHREGGKAAAYNEEAYERGIHRM